MASDPILQLAAVGIILCVGSFMLTLILAVAAIYLHLPVLLSPTPLSAPMLFYGTRMMLASAALKEPGTTVEWGRFRITNTKSPPKLAA